MNNSQPLNICVLKYGQNGKTFTATSASMESKDHAIEQGLAAFEKIQLEENVNLKLLEVYSEWKPSDKLLERINSMYPGLKISYSFQDGEENEFNKAIKTNEKRKWWQFWK